MKMSLIQKKIEEDLSGFLRSYIIKNDFGFRNLRRLSGLSRHTLQRLIQGEKLLLHVLMPACAGLHAAGCLNLADVTKFLNRLTAAFWPSRRPFIFRVKRYEGDKRPKDMGLPTPGAFLTGLRTACKVFSQEEVENQTGIDRTRISNLLNARELRLVPQFCALASFYLSHLRENRRPLFRTYGNILLRYMFNGDDSFYVVVENLYNEKI